MTKRSAFYATTLFLFGVLCSPLIAFGDENLTVQFMKDGRSHTVTGNQVEALKYVFNAGAEKKVSIATLDWAPYIDRNICKQGWVQQLTVALLASKDYEVTSFFYPWARSVNLTESGMVDMLYPEYFIEPKAPSDVFDGTLRLDHLALSEKIPGGPIAFMRRKDTPIKFNGDLMTVSDYLIGVVRGYQNTPEFDSLMDQGIIKVSEAVDDLVNARKLFHRRVELIIGDPSAINFTIANTHRLSKSEKDVILNAIDTVEPVIQYNHLYYAISKKRPGWKTLLKDVNDAIAEFKESGEMRRIIEATNDACGFQMETWSGYSLNDD